MLKLARCSCASLPNRCRGHVTAWRPDRLSHRAGQGHCGYPVLLLRWETVVVPPGWLHDRKEWRSWEQQRYLAVARGMACHLPGGEARAWAPTLPGHLHCTPDRKGGGVSITVHNARTTQCTHGMEIE